MKKSLFIIALACLMTFTACKKDKENQGEAQFTATTEHQGGRTSLNPNNGNITWTSGDQIVIANDNDETAVFSLQSGEGTTEGGFGTSGEFNTVGPFIAAYPSDAVIGNDKVTFNLPATQSIENTETFANGANPMVACSDDKNLSFKNLCGGLGIRLKGVGAHVSAVRITSKNTTEKLWGTFEVSNCAANEPTLTEASGNQGSNVITLTCDVTLTTAAKTFFVMLPPGTLANGFTMEVMDGDEVLATKETTSDVAFVERNLVKVFNEILIDVEFDGNVEIPTGMSNSNIIVTNFCEDAVPDENGDFSIGYSKMLVAKNADNGEIMYYTIHSIDNSIRNAKGNDYELSAKETAVSLSIRMLPVILGNGSDDILNMLKDVLYSLPCVQGLELSIQNTLNQYGYLKEDELASAINAVKSFIYTELGVSGDKNLGVDEHSVSFNIGSREQTSHNPYLPVDRIHGTIIDIQEDKTYYISNPKHWVVNCTGYNGLPCGFGVVLGTADLNNVDPDGAVSGSWDDERQMYYLPPAGLTRVLDIMTLGDWGGLKQLFNDFIHVYSSMLTNSYYETLFNKAKLENMVFDLYPQDNVICMICSNDNNRVMVYNCMCLAFDAVSAVLPDLDNFFGEIVPQFISDADYMAVYENNIHNGSEGFGVIYRKTVEKLVIIGSNMAEQGLLQWVGRRAGESLSHAVSEFLESISGLEVLTRATDAGLQILGIGIVDSYGLPINAEYNNNISIATTKSYEVLSTTQAVVTAEFEDPEFNHAVEYGVCYSTSSLPTIYDVCVPLPSPIMAGCYQFQLEGLQPSTFYYARAYAKLYFDMLSYGEVVSFDTYNQPTVTTHEVQQSNIGSTSATVTGSIVFLEPNQLAEFEHGFVLGDSPNGLLVTSENLVEPYNGSELLNYSFTFTDLWPNTKYYVRAYSYSPRGDVVYGKAEPFITLPSGGGGSYNGHEYVDLGLPSGLLWATCNVGAETPEGYGDYFAWGEIQSKSSYALNTYRFLRYGKYTRYCHNPSDGYNGYTDTLTVLLSGDDAATAIWGEGWRMPTKTEWEELLQNTIQQEMDLYHPGDQPGDDLPYGKVFLLTASNGNSIYLPAAGYRYDDYLADENDLGFYWSSSFGESSWTDMAWGFKCDDWSGSSVIQNGRYEGLSVRPVRSAR